MLALICGTGGLPAAVAGHQDVPPVICVLDGFAPDELAADITFPLEKLGTLLATLQARGVSDVCLCGAITRPTLDPSLIDAATLPLLPTIQAALGQGDDGALRAVIAVFEQAGFTLRAAHDLAPNLLMKAGVPTRVAPGPQAQADTQKALTALDEMGRRDVGQACIIRKGAVVALEGQDGTDAMLLGQAQNHPTPWDQSEPLGWPHETADGLLQPAEVNTTQRPGGILFKAPKPNQDRRADLPTIGVKTAMAAVQAGLDGLVIEAEGVIVLEQSDVLQVLDAMGMFLWVRAR